MRRYSLILITLLLIAVPFVQAQDTTELDIPLLASGDSISASFEDNATTHLYAFYGSEGNSVTIDMEQETDDLDPFLVLFDSEGQVIAYDDDSGATDFSASIQNAELEDNGIYFVMASSALFVDAIETETDSELPYTLSISGQNTPEDIEDDSVLALEIDVISIGDSVDGESIEEAPLALFYLEADSGDTVTISLENADFFTLLMVFAPDGSRMAADASLAQLDLEDDGIYIIVATGQFFYESMDANGLFEGGTFVLVTE